MSGLVAGSSFASTFVGDESLSRRPMKRIVEPLRKFGATVTARDDNYLPLTVQGGNLFPVSLTMQIASAQVKSAILLAGLHAPGLTRVREPMPTRNHTELALAKFGARIKTSGDGIEIEGGRPLHGKEMTVPGDLSSAAFLIAAAVCVPDSTLTLTGVGLNPTRSGFLSLLQEMGARIEIAPSANDGGEPAGDISVKSSTLAGMDVGGAWIPNVIDEIPMLAVLGTQTQKGMRIRDAAELRAKESDRIRAVAAKFANTWGRGRGISGWFMGSRKPEDSRRRCRFLRRSSDRDGLCGCRIILGGARLRSKIRHAWGYRFRVSSSF